MANAHGTLGTPLQGPLWYPDISEQKEGIFEFTKMMSAKLFTHHQYLVLF